MKTIADVYFFLKRIYEALKAENPPTRPPTKPVTKTKINGLPPVFNNCPMRPARIPSLAALIDAARTTHNKKIAVKPATKAAEGLNGKSITTIKAATAMVHHEKYSPAKNAIMAINKIFKIKRMILI